MSFKQVAIIVGVTLGLAALLIGGVVFMVFSTSWISQASAVRMLDAFSLVGGISLFVLGAAMTLGAVAIAVNAVTFRKQVNDRGGRLSP